MEIVMLIIAALAAGYVWQFISGKLASYVPSNSFTTNKFVAVAITGGFILLTMLVVHFLMSLVRGRHHKAA